MDNIDEIYKGDGITTCRWCGDTGWMKTFGLTGIFYNDAPCMCCKTGRKILDDLLQEKENNG